jgi:hypothetical protein
MLSMFAATLSAMVLLLSALDDSPQFLEGSSLYQQLEYEASIERFRAASIEPDRTDGDRARLLVWEAMAQAGIGDMDAMAQALDQALALDARVGVPAIAAPLVREQLEEKRAAIAAAVPAAVVEPSVDDRQDGETAPSSSTWRLWTGGGAAGLGILGLAGAGVAGVLAAGSMQDASRSDAFQLDAVRAVQQANNQVAVASVLGAGALLLVGTGTSLIAWQVLDE